MVCAEIIKHILETDEEITVIGWAKNGKEAISLVPELKPDIITMDIHMPEMNGLEATEYIMAYNPTPIIIVSSSVHQVDTHLAFEAISAGALDVLEKPDPIIWEAFAEVGKELIEKVKFFSKVRVITHIKGKNKFKRLKSGSVDSTAPAHDSSFKIRPEEIEQQGIVVLGASTGGPSALAQVIEKIPTEFSLPVVIGQHITEGFVSGFADWLQSISKLPVKMVDNDMEVKPASIYVCPVNKNTVITGYGRFKLIKQSKNELYRPSINMLFESAAEVYLDKVIAAILTGMGNDGSKGIKAIYEKGGYTIAQDEATSTIFGMPKAAIETGAIKEILPLGEIGEKIVYLSKKIV